MGQKSIPPYESVTNMLSELGWRSLEDRQIDAQLIMFYKIVHGYVAIQLPAYFDKPLRCTRHMHPFSFRQIHTAVSYYQYSYYPASAVLWNRPPLKLSFWEILTHSGKESARSTIGHLKLNTLFLNLFYLHLFCTNTISSLTIALFISYNLSFNSCTDSAIACNTHNEGAAELIDRWISNVSCTFSVMLLLIKVISHCKRLVNSSS